MQIVHDSQSKQLDLESIGIKGAALRHLRSLRLYVPKFFVLTSSFFEALAEQSGFAQKARFAAENLSEPDELAREFERLLDSFSVPHDLVSSLDEPLRELSGQGSLRAVVRPSRPYMSKIDSKHHLNLTSKAEVVAAITEVFKEHFSPDAVVERLEKDLPAVHLKLPMILQVFVNPDVTGIVMPYRAQHGFYYLTAWKGFGFELDFHKADHYLVNYKDLMLERFLNNTSGDVLAIEESSGSITRTKILHEEAKEPFLDHDQIIELCKLYAEHASDLGGLAIEFKIKGSDVSFISLKDAAILEKAERSLEELRSARAPQEAREDTAVEEEEPARQTEVDASDPHEGPRASEGDAVGTSDEKPTSSSEHAPPLAEEDVHDEALAREADDPRPSQVPELSHGSDDAAPASKQASDGRGSDGSAAAEVSRIIAKYIEINPALERQFRLLEQDLLDALGR